MHTPRAICLAMAMTFVGCAKEPRCHGEEDFQGGPAADERAMDVFTEGRILSVALSLPADEWVRLKTTAREEIHTPARALIDGEDLGTVGLRFKGDYGTLYSCFDEHDQLVCPKLSMKLKFSKYDPDKRYHGLKRLNLHAMIVDRSLMREYLAYKVFRDAGIITSRVSYAEVTVNGEHLGLYAVVEQQDGPFIDDRFPARSGGNLYKQVWPVSPHPDSYAEALKTHGDIASHEGIVAFAKAVTEAADDTLPAVVREFADATYWTTYMAVNDAINNWDGIGTWYCYEDTGCRPHNFYLYEERGRPYFWILPWDLDSTFTLNAESPYPPLWNDLSVDCSELVLLPNGGPRVMPPSCDPLIRSIALQEGQGRLDAIDEVLKSAFDSSQLLAQIDLLVELLAPAVARDPVWDLDDWLSHVEILQGNIPLLADRLVMMRDGKDVSPKYLSADDLNDYENTNGVAVREASVFWSNPGSSAALRVNETRSLQGAKDLRFELVFRNDGDGGYDAWALACLKLGEIVDFTRLESMRVSIRADRSRWVQLGMAGPLATGMDSGLLWGWNIAATAEPQDLELSVAELALPWWHVPAGHEDDLGTVMTQVDQLCIVPFPATYGEDGLLPQPEPALVAIDDLKFVWGSTR